MGLPLEDASGAGGALLLAMTSVACEASLPPSLPPTPQSTAQQFTREQEETQPIPTGQRALEVKGQPRSQFLEATSPLSCPQVPEAPCARVPPVPAGSRVCPWALTEALSGLESPGGESPGLRPLDSAWP